MSDLDLTGTTSSAGHLPDHLPRRLRVAVVAESLAPEAELTAHVCRTLAHLHRRGHDAVLVCPRPAPRSIAGAPVVTVSPARLPGLARRLGLPSPTVMRTLAGFAPDGAGVPSVHGPGMSTVSGASAAGH